MSANEPAKGKRRFFAVTSRGKNNWHWVVWPSLAELQASEEPLLHIFSLAAPGAQGLV